MQLHKELVTALQDTPASAVLALTEQLYAAVMAKVKEGKGTQEDIQALNFARKEIKECKQLGIGE